MINTKTGFAVLIFLLSMSSLLNSCTKNTESNISIDAESSKPKAQLVSSKDPNLATDEYKIVTSSFGCYSDFLFPQAEEKHHILLTKSIDIKKEFANQREWIQMPNEMVSVRRINTEEEVKKMSHHNYKNSRFTSEKKCDIVDPSNLILN